MRNVSVRTGFETEKKDSVNRFLGGLLKSSSALHRELRAQCVSSYKCKVITQRTFVGGRRKRKRNSFVTRRHTFESRVMLRPSRKGALEVFKFGVYLFVPFIVMVAYGSPEWYKKNVLPVSLACPESFRTTEF